jgi:hypothetical protein
MKMAEEKDEFEKLKKRIKEDTWEDYEGNSSHIDYDTIIEIIEEFKPKLKAQILQDNPMAGLTDADIHNLLDVLNWLKYDDVEKTTNARLKLKRELLRREEKKED